MSAPKTDLDKQEKRHRGPLGGMALAVVFALVLLVALITWLSANGNDPVAEGQTEGGTGIEEPLPTN